jgi:exonuclease VII small subunit
VSKLEQNLARIDEIAERAEQGKMTLAEALDTIEKSLKYLDRLQKHILEAQPRIQIMDIKTGELSPYTPPPRGEEE